MMSGPMVLMEWKAPMTSATGNFRRPSSGFSLIEIVMVLGLIAVASSVVIINFTAMADRGDAQSNQDILVEAIREARFLAASERIPVQMRFDAESAAILLIPQDAEVIPFPLSAPFEPRGRAEVRFYTDAPTRGLAPLPEQSRQNNELQQVRFSPDRSATAFTIEFDGPNASPTRLLIDPFTGLIREPKS